MHFPRPYKQKTNTSLVVSVVVGVVLIVVVSVQPTFVTRLMLFITPPFHDARENVSANAESFLGGFSSRSALVEENKKLTEELIRMKIKADLYDSLRQEYSGISKNATSSTQFIRARVLEMPPFSPYDTLLIGAGSAQGISIGDTVSFDTTVALGVVDSVSKNASRVRLFSSPGYEQEVRVGMNDFLVLARGQGGGVFEISIPKETIVARNDNVFLSGGELVGVIKKITESDAEAFTKLDVVMPQNIFELRTVVVHFQKTLE
jgi:cell shape-determining protein MreC